MQAEAEIMQCTDPHICQSEDVCTSQLRDDSSAGDEDIFMNYQLSQFYGPQFPGPSSPSVLRQPEHYHRHSFSRSPTPSTASMFSHPSSYSEVIAYILLSPDPFHKVGKNELYVNSAMCFLNRVCMAYASTLLGCVIPITDAVGMRHAFTCQLQFTVTPNAAGIIPEAIA